jgi:CRISPR-associated protein Cas1
LISRDDPAFAFPRRSRRPPEDAVNALLGFVYSLLEKDVHAACVIAGLDPYLGLLHRPRPRTPSAVLDLMEAFRPVVADSVVLSLVNRGGIAPEHFEERDGGVYLNEEGRKRVYKAYGRRRAETVTPRDRESSLPYYRLFEREARRLVQALADASTEISVFRM